LSDIPTATHKAAIIGFAQMECVECFGRGRAGWVERDNGTVLPCRCVEYFDLEKIRESAQGEMASKEAQREQVHD
jgi:hypothetical protein